MDRRMDTLLCSIIILSYNQAEYTQLCLDSIKKYTTDVSHEIIVIDNASDDETVTWLRKRTDIKLIENTSNLGFAGGCNQGAKLAKGKYILFLNNDTIVTYKWLSNMIAFLEENPEASMTGPLTNATVGKQMISVTYGKDLEQMQNFAADISKRSCKPWRTLRLVAFCLLVRSSLLDEIGLFDTAFQVGNYEDDDFNLRALCAGKKAYICRNSFIHHFMNVSFRQKEIGREKIMMKNKRYLEEKWEHLDWNYHSVFNSYMKDTILKHSCKKLLHIGCGLGALEIEIRDQGIFEMHMTGIEYHPIRRKIASEFMDSIYPDEECLDLLEEAKESFDVIVLEGILERLDKSVLKKIVPLLSENGKILLRVFNAGHITTLERVIRGEVGGDLLCASSPQFVRYFFGNIDHIFLSEGLQVVERKEIRKNFSAIQEQIYQAVLPLLRDSEEPYIYNRIYHLERK